MSTTPLTAKQERIWRYIKSCERSPTYRQVAADLGLKSVGELHASVLSLKRRGYVTYIPGVARSLVALDPVSELAGFSTSELASELARRLAVANTEPLLEALR